MLPPILLPLAGSSAPQPPRRSVPSSSKEATGRRGVGASAKLTNPTVISPIVIGQRASAEMPSAIADRSIGHSGRIDAPAPSEAPSAGFQSKLSQLMSSLHGLKCAYQTHRYAIPDSAWDRPRLGLIGNSNEDRL